MTIDIPLLICAYIRTGKPGKELPPSINSGRFIGASDDRTGVGIHICTFTGV